MMQGHSVKKDWFLFLKAMRLIGSLLHFVIYHMQKRLVVSLRLCQAPLGRISKIVYDIFLDVSSLFKNHRLFSRQFPLVEKSSAVLGH